jgi:hypothetical protein
MPRPTRLVGAITRGTTHPNRLRRIDRWIVAVLGPRLRRLGTVDIVDLGFGASPITTVELAARLRSVAPQARVIGLEIDAGRVASARALYPDGSFDRGGFELGSSAGRVGLVRALNVLRQYDGSAVPDAWRAMVRACVPGGAVVEGTCDELGRLAAWVLLENESHDPRPRSLTLSMRLAGLQQPSDVAARLPKALIHHNIPGQPVHRFLASLDAAWVAAAPYQDLSARQRWIRTVSAVQLQGYRVHGRPSRWRLGEVTVAWEDVAPAPSG